MLQPCTCTCTCIHTCKHVMYMIDNTCLHVQYTTSVHVSACDVHNDYMYITCGLRVCLCVLKSFLYHGFRNVFAVHTLEFSWKYGLLVFVGCTEALVVGTCVYGILTLPEAEGLLAYTCIYMYACYAKSNAKVMGTGIQWIPSNQDPLKRGHIPHAGHISLSQTPH